MSKLAIELPKADFGKAPHKGPRGICYTVYGSCDLDDLAAVKALKETGLTWEQIQEQVDKILGIENPIPRQRFIYHFRSLCRCWESASE